MKIIRIFVTFIFLFLTSCSMFWKEEKKKDTSHIDYPPELKTVNALVIDKKFDDAIIKIEDYLNRAKNIHWYGHAYYLKGFVFESSDRPDEAINFYRQAIQHASQYDSVVEAKAIYNLSYVYEKTGQMSDLSSTLIDLMERKQHFNVLTAHVETPARLAASFASLGQMEKARRYHKQASESFNKMVRHNLFRASKEDISQALYYLGLNIYPTKNEDFEKLNTKISLGQRYFLASAEASISSWSKKSAKKLLLSYENLWSLIKKYEPEDKLDPVAKKKKKHEMQLLMSADFYDHLHRIKVEEFPLSKVNRNSKHVIDKIDRWIAKVEDFAQELSLGPEATRTGKVKQRRLLKVIDPKLEKKIMEYNESLKTRDPNSAIAH